MNWSVNLVHVIAKHKLFKYLCRNHVHNGYCDGPMAPMQWWFYCKISEPKWRNMCSRIRRIRKDFRLLLREEWILSVRESTCNTHNRVTEK